MSEEKSKEVFKDVKRVYERVYGDNGSIQRVTEEMYENTLGLDSSSIAIVEIPGSPTMNPVKDFTRELSLLGYRSDVNEKADNTRVVYVNLRDSYQVYKRLGILEE